MGKTASRVEMIKTMALVEIPTGTRGTVLFRTERMLMVAFNNGYVIPMYRHEVIELADEVL